MILRIARCAVGKTKLELAPKFGETANIPNKVRECAPDSYREGDTNIQAQLEYCRGHKHPSAVRNVFWLELQL